MGNLEVPRARLHYETYGSGPLLLMVPGANGSADAFKPVAEYLAAKYTVANRIVLAAGRESRGYPAYQVNVELAKKLGKDIVELPGGHLGFVSQPAEFARELGETLARQQASVRV